MASNVGRDLVWMLAVASGVMLATRVDTAVAASGDPLRVQGLELADGRIAAPPSSPVWGAAAKLGSRSGALERLRAEVDSAWVSWDDARGCASGIMVSGVAAPGTTRSASVAEAFARAFVARHLQAIAPGRRIDELVVVANDVSSGIRTIGFAQHRGGVPVLGGQLSVRFAHDRLVYVAATLLPAIELPMPDAPDAPDALVRAQARAFVLRDYADATLEVGGIDGRFVLPVWSGSGWRYHDVVRVDVRSRAPLGHWSIYLDAATGEPIAREQLMHDAATVRFDVPVRYPAARYDAVAPQLALTEGGNAALTDLNGDVTLSNSPTTVDLHATGPLIEVVNNGGAAAAASFPAQDGATVTWSLADDQFGDAQLSAFVHVSRVNAYVREIAPTLDWLDTTVTANVNIDNTCNAVSDGNTLYFFRAGDCENTARIADVVYHEFGHSVHRAAIIPGVGAQSSALSEGISDYLAASMTNDSGMGRGFVFTDAPLRELDPPDSEWSWPQDQGESHNEGRIIGGTLWDLRKALRTKLGDEPGRIQTDAIWYEAIRRAVDIPSMYAEALVGDDDDGDLSNGTPNVCEVNAAFQAHGLLDPAELADIVLDVATLDEGRRVTVTQALPMFEDCPVVAGEAALRWRLRDTPDEVNELVMTVEDGAWVATIPTQATGVVVEYQVRVAYSSGSEAALPRNLADPWYQLFFGGAQPIYCLDADADQSAWSFAGGGNWGFGPLAVGGVDPGEPYDDDGVLLSQDGIYSPSSSSSATGPMIDLTGHQDVRLQYRRWLTVEDAHFDQATILANGQEIWRNLGTEAGNVQHVDREWVFQDIPLVDALATGNVQLQLALSSDQGLQFGGWTVDALCVVEVVESWCGDGNLGGDEECDDENNDDDDGCDATCHVEDPDPTGDDTGGSSGDDGTDDGASLTSADDSGGIDTVDGNDDGTSSGGAAQDDSTDGCGCDTRGRTGVLPLLAGFAMLGLPRRRRF